MYHTIKFETDATIDLEISAKQPLERLLVRRGSRLRAQLKPHVVETPNGFVEMADLFFADGSTARAVPFERISFVD